MGYEIKRNFSTLL